MRLGSLIVGEDGANTGSVATSSTNAVASCDEGTCSASLNEKTTLVHDGSAIFGPTTAITMAITMATQRKANGRV